MNCEYWSIFVPQKVSVEVPIFCRNLVEEEVTGGKPQEMSELITLFMLGQRYPGHRCRGYVEDNCVSPYRKIALILLSYVCIRQ